MTDSLTPYVKNRLTSKSDVGRGLNLIYVGKGVYEVVCLDRSYTVNLRKRVCESRAWDINGIPCKHAVICITHNCATHRIDLDLSKFIHPSMTKDAFMRTYRSII